MSRLKTNTPKSKTQIYFVKNLFTLHYHDLFYQKTKHQETLIKSLQFQKWLLLQSKQ